MSAAKSRYAIPALVCAVSGCRPEELRKGVRMGLQQRDDGELLGILIDGAKCGVQSGQPARTLYFDDLSHDLLRALRDVLLRVQPNERRTRTMGVKITNPICLSGAIARYARKLWPNLPRLSAYHFRYQFFNDLRMSGVSRADRAQAMGHAGDGSQRYYHVRLGKSFGRGASRTIGDRSTL